MIRIVQIVLCAGAVGLVGLPSWPGAVGIAALALVVAFDRFADGIAARGSLGTLRDDNKAVIAAVEALSDETRKLRDSVIRGR